MNFIKRKNNCFLFFAFFVLSITTYAQDHTAYSSSEIAVANSLQHITTNLATSTTMDVAPYTYISLGIKEGVAPYTNYNFKLAFTLTPVLPDGTPDSANIIDVELDVENGQVAGGGNHIGLKQYILEDNYGAILNNVTTFFDENGTTSTTIVPANIELEIGFKTTRYYDLPLTVPTITPSVVNNELQINWNAIPEARYYDVEWTWVDNYGENISTPLGQGDIYFSKKEFQRNSTRIQTDKTNYNIPLLYGKGYVIFRVRTVGSYVNSTVTIEDLSKNKYGPWTSGLGAKEFVSNWPNVIEIAQDHEGNKNWQFQSSYAEEGKKKEVVSYFDGTLRNRQTVTTINTDENAVIGEVIYDAQGRPAIEVLPTPIADNELKYHEAYRNRNINDVPYHYTDFDMDSQNVVDVLSPDKRMSTTSGASQYYSPANASVNEYKDRIPNANLYPFSQIEYASDGTGRMRRKSGVGITHQFGAKHEMEYYYGVPEQKELNRLFGYSVGSASKYKKNMVLDPNRQLSISYLDPQGRTIATALAGEHPKDLDGNTILDGLYDELDNTLHGLVATDLLGKIVSTDTDTTIDNNQLGSVNYGPLYDKLSYGAYKTVVFNETRLFDYKVTNEHPFFKYGCVIDDSYPVVYDLAIDVINEDADPIISSPVSETIDLGNSTQSPSNVFTLDQRTAPVKRGTFMVTKNLTVNRDKLEEYADDYITRLTDENDPCFKPLETIVPEPLFIDGCFSNCLECEQSITDLYATDVIFADSKMANYTQAQIDQLNLDNQYQALYDSLKQQWADAIASCNLPCVDGGEDTPLPTISCEIATLQFIEDMSPNGQYGLGLTTNDASVTIFNDKPLSIYNTDNVLLSTQSPSGGHNSWKNPKHNEYVSNPNHYYNNDGTISYIKVELIDAATDAYTPQIDASAISTLTPTVDVAITNEYWVEPQYLSDVLSFLHPNVWKSSWVNSLIVYHPEYDYLEYANKICAMESAHPNNAGEFLNSDTYDSYLQSITTYEDAVSAGLLTDDPLVLYINDPYFQNTPDLPFETSALYNNGRREIMEIALGSSFDGSNRLMMTLAFSKYVCNSLEVCDDLSTYSVVDIINAMNDPARTDAERNEFWNSYKISYIGLKQRVQSLFINSYAKKQGSYNGCIGLSDAPLNLAAAMNAYPTAAAVIESYLSGTTDVLCEYADANAYLNKVKRFIPSDMFYNSAADPIDIAQDISEQVDYNYYIESGTCPLARDLELYLGYYFKEVNDSDPALSIIGSRPYNGVYLSPPLFEDFGGVFPATTTVDMLGNISGQTYNLQLQAGALLPNSNVSLMIPSGYQWDQYGTEWTITSLNTILGSYNNATQEFNFEIVAHISTPQGNNEIILNGTTKARISDCSINDSINPIGEYLGTGNSWDESGTCNKETYASKAFIGLFNTLIDNNNINNSGVDISNLEAYATSYLPEFFDYGSNVIWNATGSTYTITIDGVQKFVMNLNTPIPDNVEITNVGFNYLLSSTNTIIGQEIKVTWLDSNSGINFAEGSVFENTKRILNFLCCADINDLYTEDPCANLSCEDIFIQILNFLKDPDSDPTTQDSIISKTTPFELNNSEVAKKTCIDEFFNLTPSDTLIWWKANDNTYTLSLNGVVIFSGNTGIVSLDTQNIVSFNGINTSDPNNVTISYYDKNGVLQTLGVVRFNLDCNAKNQNKVRQEFSIYASAQILSDMDECDVEEPCIPQPLAPVTCDEKYPFFQATISALADTEQTIEYEDFCLLQYKHLAEDYKYYIEQLVLADPTNPYPLSLSLRYITIANFGATVFGYGYTDMNVVIDAYKNHVTTAANEDAIQTWSAFTSYYLTILNNAGETCVGLPVPVIIPTGNFTVPGPSISSCLEFSQSVHNSYAQDAYTTFLGTEREDFIKAYLKNAIDNAIENFDMVYYDKEYQYTLYYYDQAGNLKQTVPPEGIDRFSNSELDDVASGETVSFNDKINEYRNNNTATENAGFLPDHKYKTYYKYNTLNQLVWQLTPDGGETRFAYDKLGRIIASQNAKQLGNNTFSYTTYDDLGRITEAGELVPNVPLLIDDATGKLTSTSLSEDDIFNNQDDPVIPYPQTISVTQNEVTKTQYTTPVTFAADIFNTVDAYDVNLREKTRNRVTVVYYYDTFTTGTTLTRDYNNAIYYNYDIHGNVIELATDNKLLVQSLDVAFTGIKNVEYDYDLISGNVHRVYYQKGKGDQFIHQYTYDADNRITAVETSSDGYVWEKDATYDYFAHGPLARTILGDTKVQGLDYAYTLQGWLKGVNSNALSPDQDMGSDGETGSGVAKDAFGYSLNYFENDYQAIGSINAFVNGPGGTENARNLYNGNIKQMTTALLNLDETALATQLNNYGYDQLNRIKSMQGYALNGAVATTNYDANYSYDRNGNLKTLSRSTDSGNAMDELAYHYKQKLNPISGLLEDVNQLATVKDAEGQVVGSDLDTQLPGVTFDVNNENTHNYIYDEIGQLTSDAAEGITNIDWRVDGKVNEITKQDGTRIKFTYDGLGNRVAKTVLPLDITTLYQRDAQGNVMAVYETNESDIANISENKNTVLKEHHIYGSSRLGIEQKNVIITETGTSFTQTVVDNLTLDNNIVTGSQLFQAVNSITVAGLGNSYTIQPGANVTMEAGNTIVLKPGFIATSGSDFLARIAPVDPGVGDTNGIASGDKRYELSNHLGNVLSVVTDRKIYDGTVTGGSPFKADVIAFNDYYPFGMLVPNRHASSAAYRYGFQGQEKDDEIKGEGNSLNYKFRMHDPRVGRFFAIDPLTANYPHYTPYSFSGNKVIHMIELEGLEEKDLDDMYNDVMEIAEVFTSGQILEGPLETLKDVLHYSKGALIDYAADNLGMELSKSNVQEFHIGMKIKGKIGPLEGGFGPEIAVGNSDIRSFTSSKPGLNSAGRFKADGTVISSNNISKLAKRPSEWVGSGVNIEFYAGFTFDDKPTVTNGHKSGTLIEGGQEYNLMGTGGGLKAKSTGGSITVDAVAQVGLKAQIKTGTPTNKNAKTPVVKQKSYFTGAALATDK